jgi:hypothetical protein
MPNFMSYFEGHYYVVMPPLLWAGLLPWWVKAIFGRDPAFAKTMHTEINPLWVRRTVKRLASESPVRLISMGEEVFRDRLKAPSFDFQQQSVALVIAPVVKLLMRLNFGGLAANVFIWLQAHYPIYLTIAKEELRG